MKLAALVLTVAASQWSFAAEPASSAPSKVATTIESAVQTHKAKDRHCLVSHQLDIAGNAHPESVEAHTEANYVGLEKSECPSEDKKSLSVVPPGR